MKFAVFLLLVSAVAKADYKLEGYVGGLTAPVHAAFVPGTTNEIVAVEQAGKIILFKNGKRQEKPFLDIEKKVVSGGEMGLLSIAFHPKYAENGRYFVYYTANRPSLESVVSEFKKGSTEEKEIFSVSQPFVNHNGGQLAFGPDNLLYIGLGDGGSAGDPYKNGQNKKVYLGKMLTMDVDKTPLAKPEIYAWGLRNPWRFSFDRKTGTLWTGDVGQNRFEEIHIIEKGKNYGWNIMEGNHCFEPRSGCNTKGLEPAIFEYDRKGGISITGGFVYRGSKFPELVGKYIYSDYGSGKIWALEYDPKTKKTNNTVLISSGKPISSFGEEADGELLIVSHGGNIYRIAKVATP